MEFSFVNRLEKYVFLNGGLSDEPVNSDILGLAYPMTPILSLLVHGWVPVGVVENDTVCSGQVESYPSTSGRTDETLDVLVLIEVVH